MVRIYGQMLLSRVVEECWINNIVVISVNTDGIETIIPKNKIKLYDSIISGIEKEFKVKFESADYIKIVYKNVNNYIAITSSEIKQKGSSFIIKPLLGNSNDFLVIPKALNKYFVNGIKPETILNNKEWNKHFHIFDFCASYKISKKYTVLYNNQKQQQLNRFFVSEKGYYLYKQKKGKNMENVLKGFGVELLNRYDKNRVEYKIDFKYYLSKINEIINELESKQTTMHTLW